jgi:rhamnopyranosyl-N-acetylglucosaminyl-diphospho-decaprenol beta-1,3/1,4-galactofuranosyltransferase
MLASTRLIKKISPPDPSYFIYHDDTVFGIKASFHTNVIYVRDAIFLKKVYGYGAITPFRCYYMIRNTFRLKREVFDTGLVGSSSKLSNFLFFVNLTVLTLKSIRQKKELDVLKSLFRGWRDGFRGV